MAVKIRDVERSSVCGRKGLRPGDTLISINGNEINDVLDYRFYADERKLKLEYINAAGRTKHAAVKNMASDHELGLTFDTFLMDRHRSCKNHCIFCFIDQLPRGMRESLYFKDDDSRLSFLFGNYITLTNLSEHDVERIIKMKITPLNVSVHTMDPELRVRMMRNPHAGEALGLLRRFSDAGIRINAQLVLCPGINDGAALEYSLRKLSELNGVQSIAAVPAGLTKYREGLYPLNAYSPEQAGKVIDMIDAFNNSQQASGAEKIAFPSDEFFQLAGRELPEDAYYCDYPQLDNGVGLCTLTEKEFTEALRSSEKDSWERSFAVATGSAAFPLIKKLAGEFCKKFKVSDIKVYEIKNRFFGESVTVAGLITGSDLISGLSEQGFKSDTLLLPSVMFRGADDLVFLDDITKEDVEKKLGTTVKITGCDGASLFDMFYSQGFLA